MAVLIDILVDVVVADSDEVNAVVANTGEVDMVMVDNKEAARVSAGVARFGRRTQVHEMNPRDGHQGANDTGIAPNQKHRIARPSNRSDMDPDE
ncbi:hypothetical protein RvY_17938 [Ramazzottius varieornatus]|uniref:Uncharacterized protein n=1 Tax=Ramazzottius varieornatus TaxID=947166 RepID=A0A1D1W402_RAMVA|nr:hypothetical protein RvY_17938 [Ramazzottius varieornatus]